METALNNWINLNKALSTLDERAAYKLLQRERDGKQRINFLLRLHGRYNKLRAVRERKELLSNKKEVR